MVLDPNITESYNCMLQFWPPGRLQPMTTKGKTGSGQRYTKGIKEDPCPAVG